METSSRRCRTVLGRSRRCSTSTYSYLTIPDIERRRVDLEGHPACSRRGYSLDAVNIVVRDYTTGRFARGGSVLRRRCLRRELSVRGRLRHVLTLIEESTRRARDATSATSSMLSAADRTELDTFASRKRRLMLDLAQNVTVDRLAAGVPGERHRGDVGRRDAQLCGVRRRRESHRGSVARQECRARRVRRGDCAALARAARCDPRNLARGRRAYVPIDPAYPAIRIRTIIEESGARVIVAGTRIRPKWLMNSVLIASRPSIAGRIRSSRSPRPRTWLTSSYTSGSTGRPRGRDDRAPVGGEPAAAGCSGGIHSALTT